MLNAVLKVVTGQQTGTLIPLPVGRFLIGREEDCQLRPNSEMVSRHHCVFSNDEYTVRVRDLGSTNGTFVNGEAIRGGVELKSRDLVSVGKIEFQVMIGEDADSAVAEVNGAAPAADDTGTSASIETSTEIPSPGAAPAPVEAAAPSADDTVYQGVPGQMPGYVYPPYIQQPYPYGYPPPGYPGYYPQMPMAYPGQPQQYAAPAAPPAEATPEAGSNVPEVRLPDPSTTGAKPPEPSQPSASGEKKGENVPEQAANIIKQYLQRRPTSD